MQYNENTLLVLPISRDDFLDDFVTSIELLECYQTNVSVLCIVDGDSNLYLKVRNKFLDSKYNEVLTVQYKDNWKPKTYSVLNRRIRISKLHNFAKQYIGDKYKYVMIIEDDTIVPRDAFKKLYNHYLDKIHAGFIQGIEAGRWGIKYLGAWNINDIYNPTEITSTELLDGLQEVDAGGFYCMLTRADNYMKHDFKGYDYNQLGPDVDYGIEMRQLGMQNYTDYSIKCIHKRTDGNDVIVDKDYNIVKHVKNNNDNRWRVSHV